MQEYLLLRQQEALILNHLLTEDSHAWPSACKIAEATRSACKTAGVVDLFLNNDEKTLNKINFIKLAKYEVVYHEGTKGPSATMAVLQDRRSYKSQSMRRDA